MEFLIIGAAKAATSSLWALVRSHPEIYMPMPKELPFFSGPEYALGWQEFARRNLRDVPRGAKVGKATPAYMAGVPMDRVCRTSPEREIPERIASLFPNVKLIAILRDPVERALSHYTMARNLGAEDRDVEVAFEELLESTALKRARTEPGGRHGYVVLGEYARVLHPYVEIFDRSQLLTLSTAQLSTDPLTVLNSVWAFLGVPAHTPDDLDRRYMVSAGLTENHGRLLGMMDQRRPGVRLARRAVRAMPPMVSAPIRRSYWSLVARGVSGSGDEQPGDTGPPLPAETRARLVSHYESDSDQLRSMFGWTPLRGQEADRAGSTEDLRRKPRASISP